MEYTKRIETASPLLCLRYQINPKVENKVNFIATYNSFLGRVNHKYPSLKQLKRDQKIDDYEDYIKLEERRNYEESDLFSMKNLGKILMNKNKQPSQPFQLLSRAKPLSPERDNLIRNNLNFPNEHNMNNLNGNDNHNATIDFLPNLIPKTNEIHPSSTGGEEIDKLIVLFPQLSDIKTRGQTIKKFVSYYKKNRYDELKLTSFFMSLSSQINESSAETKSWILYEYLRTRLESSLTSICKEMTKIVAYIQANNINLANGDALVANMESVKKLVTMKIKDYLIGATEEEETIASKPFIRKFLENFNPNKGKKKETLGFYKERLNKKIKEQFEKYHIKISDEKIASMFYPTILPNEPYDINHTTNNEMPMYSLNEKNSFNNSIDNSSRALEDDKNASSYNPLTHNNMSSSMNKNSIQLVLPPNFLLQQEAAAPINLNQMMGDKEPACGKRFKVKQYSEDDF